MLSLLSKMMRGESSNSTSNGSLPKPIQTNLGSLYASDLSSYKKACELDPDLKSFDASLHERTNRVLTSLSPGPEGRAFTFDSLIEVTGGLLDMNQEVLKFIIESKEDVWNNKDLTSLVNVYFESSVKTLDFCNAVENCVKRAKISHMIIQFAIRQFEREVEMESREGVVEKKYEKTLEELNKFKAAGNPFTEDFFTLFGSVYDQQVLLLAELHKQKERLDKKMRNIKSWRKISNIVFVTAFVSVLIFSVVAAAVAAPPVVTAVAAALAVPIGSVGKWCSHLWTKYENAVKGQKDIVLSMRIGTFAMKEDMRTIHLLVKKLEIEIEGMLQRADFAIREEGEAVRFAIDEIWKKLDVFMERIEDLGQHAAKCNKNITLARTIVLRHIISYPSISSTQADLMDVLPM